MSPSIRVLAASVVCFTLTSSACTWTHSTREPSQSLEHAGVEFQLIRSATIKIDYAGTTFLVDPMLGEKGAFPGFPGTYNSHLRNPLVDLPVALSEVMDVDAVIVTHLHPDHWDETARRQLPKSMPIFVQDEHDAAAVRNDGFTDVRVLGNVTMFNGTRLTRVGGQHGTDRHMAELGVVLGSVSGIVFERPRHVSVYVAGDTIWSPPVEATIQTHHPDVIVLNTGYASISGFDGSIIMGKEDLARARALAADAVLIGVHMEAVNHAMQSRAELVRYIVEQNLDVARTRIPADGEVYRFDPAALSVETIVRDESKTEMAAISSSSR